MTHIYKMLFATQGYNDCSIYHNKTPAPAQKFLVIYMNSRNKVCTGITFLEVS